MLDLFLSESFLRVHISRLFVENKSQNMFRLYLEKRVSYSFCNSQGLYKYSCEIIVYFLLK